MEKIQVLIIMRPIFRIHDLNFYVISLDLSRKGRQRELIDIYHYPDRHALLIYAHDSSHANTPASKTFVTAFRQLPANLILVCQTWCPLAPTSIHIVHSF